MKRFRKSSRKPLRKPLRKTLRKPLRKMKGGIGKQNGQLVFSSEEQVEIDRINTDPQLKNKQAWSKIQKFEEYFKAKGKIDEYNSIINDRTNYDLLVGVFSNESLH